MMRLPNVLTIAAAGVFTFLFSSTSSACNFVERRLTFAQIRQQARENFKSASAIVDAEVVAPMKFGREWKPGFVPVAYLRIIKTWKGRVGQEDVPVVYLSSCDIGLATKGERIRILLTGEGVFRVDQRLNGGGILDLAVYQAEIDRIAGRRRPLALAHFPGAVPVLMRKRIVR